MVGTVRPHTAASFGQISPIVRGLTCIELGILTNWGRAGRFEGGKNTGTASTVAMLIMFVYSGCVLASVRKEVIWPMIL